MVADVTSPLLGEPLRAELQAAAPVEPPGTATTIWLFSREHCGPRHVARHDARAVSAVLLRHLLTTVACDGTHPDEWRFERGALGKPYVTAPARFAGALRFSVSYGANALAIAISGSYEVGVDLEPAVAAAHATIPWPELSERERALLLRLAPEKRYEKFVRMWTLKEAFTKCLGVGVSLDFDQVETSLAPPRVTSRPSDRARGRSFRFHQQRVHVGRGDHVLALACMDPVTPG